MPSLTRAEVAQVKAVAARDRDLDLPSLIAGGALFALCDAVERAWEALEAIIDHSDYCRGHRNCAKPIGDAWQRARAALPPEPEEET